MTSQKLFSLFAATLSGALVGSFFGLVGVPIGGLVGFALGVVNENGKAKRRATTDDTN
jgi:hypothetical protein